jgi:hypothetical protein
MPANLATKVTVSALVDKIVAAVRRRGPMTKHQIAEHLSCSAASIGKPIRAARLERLLAVTGKHERRQFIYGAVQQADWPVQP